MSIRPVSLPSTALRVDWLTDVRDIKKLRDAWLSLSDRVGGRTVYCDYDWIIGWYECYTGTKYTYFGQPLLGAVWDKNRLVAVAPFTTARAAVAKVPVQFVTFAGFNLQAGEFLAEENQPGAIPALLSSLAAGGRWDVLSITALQPDWKLTRSLRESACKLNLRVEMVEDDPYAVVDLAAGYEPYLMARPSRFRTNLKRWGRKLTEAGGWRIDKLDARPSETQMQIFLERMFALANEGWRAQQRGLQEERNHQPLFVSILRDFAPRGMLDFQILQIDGTDAAYCVGLVERERYFHILQGFDDRLRNLSPGAFLLQEVLKDLAQRGIRSVMSHGDYNYKKHWASAFIPQSKLLIFNRSMRAKLSCFAKVHLQKRFVRMQRVLGARTPAPERLV